ncbi:site-specific integrase [Gallionella capsiferriformans]|uniref:Integrase family protein n=1 Tax=Gallionella capsiferriformans (strain ES-2) TaxID=395494 RepID=D9SK09_GALCS|nr:site-specific integrase [Gallionella capsiferriformans]ADL56421.1 integrase family protein [Gallionella capsiferriformans ES-2]
MTKTKLHAASSSALLLQTSSAGYEFDENSNIWMLDGSISIKLSFLSELEVEERTSEGFRKSLSRFAQELSSGYCDSIINRAKKFFRVTGSKDFSAEALSSFRSKLDDEHLWELGALRSFLESWYEWQFSGITRKEIEYLDGLRIKGCVKGYAVLTNCPYSGAYTSLEHQSLLYGLANAYEEKRLSQHDYSFLLAVSMTGRRPVQIRYLRFGDLGFTDNKESCSYYLDIPRVKQQGGKTFRKEFKRVMICKDFFDALNDQRNDVISWVNRTLGDIDEGLKSSLPLFPTYNRLALCSSSDISSYHDKDFLHVTSRSINNIMFKLNSTVIAHSERTGDRLIIGCTRLRRTFATNLAEEGFGPMVIAEALDHSDTQQVGVYARSENEIAKVVDEVMAPVLAPLAMAFAGTLVESERDAVRGNDPHSRVKLNTDISVGNCGNNKFCADGWKSCYLCKRFQPWLYGPHQQALDELHKERRDQEDAGVSKKVISASDRVLLAITQVIQMCATRKAEFKTFEGEYRHE